MTELLITAERQEPATAVVALEGDVTFGNAERLARALHGALDGGATRLVVDLTGVGFMDSSGLSALLRAATTARRAGGTVRLVHEPAGPPSILRFKGVEHLVRMFPSRAEALSGDEATA